MRKKTSKLSLTKETLRTLDSRDLRHAAGGEPPSFQSGETYCWCTDSCPEREVR